MDETTYMNQPSGFVDHTHPNFVCRLRKSLHGLKQAPRAWYYRFSMYIQAHGFKIAIIDTSLFMYRNKHDTTSTIIR